MHQKTIKWGIIGLGKIAVKFATDLAKVENAILYAVASRNKEKAVQFSDKFDSKKAFDSYEDLAKDPDVDAVYIATPHSFHAVHAILCMQHKKAVLCEKPFAMNLQEVTQMIAVAKAQNVLLMEALWTYFLPHYNYVLEIVKQEKFGKLKYLEADFGFYTPYDTSSRVFKKEVGGGSLLDIGIYPIFAALSTLGMPNAVEANATFFENRADSSCSIIFKYDDAKATLKSSLLEKLPSEAVFTFDNAVVTINEMFHQPSTVTIHQNGHEETIDFGYNTIGYNFEIEHFNQMLRANKTESSIMTFNFSKNLMQLLDNVRHKVGLTY